MQAVFGSNFNELWDAKSLKINVPASYPNPLTYLVTKLFEGGEKAFVSLFPFLMQVSEY